MNNDYIFRLQYRAVSNQYLNYIFFYYLLFYRSVHYGGCAVVTKDEMKNVLLVGIHYYHFLQDGDEGHRKATS